VKIVFVSDHFSTPDEPGILRTWQLARHLCEAGDKVTVIAPERHYLFPDHKAPDTRSTLPTNMNLVALKSVPPRRESITSRLRYYWVQLARGMVETWRAGRCDIVVAGLTPSMLGIGPYLVARVRRIPFVLDERDLSLDFASEMKLLPRPLLGIARLVEGWMHRHAHLVIAVTPGMLEVLKARRVPRLALIPNGFEALPDVVRDGRALVRDRLGWTDRFVLLYAGGLGQAYDLITVLDALASIRDPTVLLAIMGEGEGKETYRRRADAEQLPVQFLAPVPKREMDSICAASDVCLLPLRDVRRSSYVLSNKLFDYLGAGAPVIASGASDSADLLEEAVAGLVVPAGSVHELADAIMTLLHQPALRQSMGSSGKAFVETHWRREQFAQEFRQLLVGLVAPEHQRTFEKQFAMIRAAYRRYDQDPQEQAKRSLDNPGVRAIAEGRWAAIAAEVTQSPLESNHRVLDVGCGGGADLERLETALNLPQSSLYGVDLLQDRIESAKLRLPEATLLVTSSHDTPFPDEFFSIVLASTLFSSILDDDLARAVASEMVRVVRTGGKIICYDVRLPNFFNSSTRPITRRYLRMLFPGAAVTARSHTLLPPLARRLGALTRILYSPLEKLPVLRSHNLTVVTVRQKDIHTRESRR